MTTNMVDPNRKGARAIKDIPYEVIEALNQGEVPCVNLMEYLATDRRLLLSNVLKGLGRIEYLKPCIDALDKQPKQTSNVVNRTIGATLLNLDDSTLIAELTGHKSDIVRSWAAYMVGENRELSIAEMLCQIEPFATDSHFNVREEAWAAVRWKIAENLSEGIDILSKWSQSDDENLRRFASEATRPRGVWCAHIAELKEHPEKVLPLLEPLKSDSSKYVRDSVGNWLNDASKSRHDFVQSLCDRWLADSDTKETAYIVKKALRTINKTITH